MKKQESLNSKPVERAHGLQANDFILIFVTGFAAPLASHICDLLLGKENNPLSSEKLLCAYFFLIALYVIFECILSCYKKTSLWKAGWKLGNSDALIIVTFIVGTSIVIRYYDTLIGASAITILFIVSIFILWRKANWVTLNSRIMIMLALIVSVIVPSILLIGFGSERFFQPENLVLLWLGQFVACLGFDAVYVFAKWLKSRNND